MVQFNFPDEKPENTGNLEQAIRAFVQDFMLKNKQVMIDVFKKHGIEDMDLDNQMLINGYGMGIFLALFGIITGRIKIMQIHLGKEDTPPNEKPFKN